MNADSALCRRTVEGLAGKYLTFRLGEEAYGLSVLKIREIIRHTNVTAVPQVPDYVKGVLNLRGKVIPVLDLRVKFGFARAEVTERTCILVVQVLRGDDTSVTMGLIVDAVESVVSLAGKDIEPTPDFGAHIDTDAIPGMATLESRIVSLIDIDRALGAALSLETMTK